MTDFAVLSPELANSFYDIRSERQTQSVNDTLMSDAVKESVLSRDSAVKKTITFISVTCDTYVYQYTGEAPAPLFAVFPTALRYDAV